MTDDKSLKCVVWDLDNTLWDGILLEAADVRLRDGVEAALRTLDDRGILHSIASRNHFDDARDRLVSLGLWDYFLYPQIHWNPKPQSIQSIAKDLNIGIDALAFIDDDPFEREAVTFALPSVTCIDAARLDQLVTLPALMPRFVTEDSRLRRHMYRDDEKRKQAELEWQGTDEELLATLDMRFHIAAARQADLQRAQELTVRTNQLNSTGITYDYDELDQLRQSPHHSLWIASLDDRFGKMGRIGLALVERDPAVWTIKLLLMSCRVMSRGVGSMLLNFVIEQAHRAGVALRADFIPNSRNRVMGVTYAFAGFKKIGEHDGVHRLELAQPLPQPPPSYVTLTVEA
jgi:FkbH-like protein